MKLKPRPYQIIALDAIWDALQTQKNVLLQAACSAGKTLMFSKITRKLLAERPECRVLILTDRDILVEQSIEKLKAIAPELMNDIGIMCASASKIKDGEKRITVASRQTLINRLDEFPAVHLTIVDECHLMAIPKENTPPTDQFGKIIERLREYNPNMRLFGVTATPYRLAGGHIYGDDNVPGSTPYFDNITHNISVEYLQSQGYLAPLIGKTVIQSNIIEDLADISITSGEYNLGELGDVMTRFVHIKAAVEAWKKNASDRKKTLAFCVTIEHAEELSQAFNTADIKSHAIHSQLTPIELEEATRALHNGTSSVFTSVAKLTTGMDIPDIDCCIMCRPTKSAALYKQMLGRFQRICDGKKDALIIDLVGNNQVFGTDLDNLKITYSGQSKRDEEKKIKRCPKCDTELHLAVRICYECNYMYPKTQEIIEAEEQALKEIEYGKQPPQKMKIIDLYMEEWLSKNSGKMIFRIRFELKESEYKQISISQWLCFTDDGYSGFAVEKGKEKWQILTNNADDLNYDDFPTSAAEALERDNEIVVPDYALVDMTPKWPEIIEFGFNTENENLFEAPKTFASETFFLNDGKIDDDDDDIPF